MRVKTDGRYAWRLDLYDDVADQLGESTRSGGLDAASELVLELVGRRQDGAIDELAELLENPRIPDDLAARIATTVSVGPLELEYRPAAASVDRPGDS